MLTDWDFTKRRIAVVLVLTYVIFMSCHAAEQCLDRVCARATLAFFCIILQVAVVDGSPWLYLNHAVSVYQINYMFLVEREQLATLPAVFAVLFAYNIAACATFVDWIMRYLSATSTKK